MRFKHVRGLAALLALVAGLGTAASALSHGAAHAHEAAHIREAAVPADQHDHDRQHGQAAPHSMTADDHPGHSHGRLGTAPAVRSFAAAILVSAPAAPAPAVMPSSQVVYPKYVATFADPPPLPQTGSRPPPLA